MLQAAFNIFFDDFWVYKPFCTVFFRWDITASYFGFLHLLYIFFVILWPKPFTLVYSICASTKIPFEPVQKLFLSTGFLGRYQVTSAWVLRKVTRLRTILWSAAG